MGNRLILRAADGHQLGAYRADAAGTPRGRIVVIQEIFGVNHHIRSVCDRLAQAGYTALAPQIFDRLVRDFESGYSEPEIAKAREYIPKLDWAKIMLDTQAAVDQLKREGPVAILGFCMGGTVAFLAATKLDGLAAAICYYGGMIAKHADAKPRCPTQMHFGELDGHIPMTDVANIRAKRPDCEIHIYQGAGHGFHCDERASYEPNSAKIAWGRSLGFLARVFSTAARPATPAMPKPQPMMALKPKAKPKAKKKAKAKAKKKTKKTKKTKKKAKKKSKKKRRR
jgi:carboxymethylenebutenolidase